MCFALPCYQLSATASSEGRKKGMQNHSTASLLSSWQKPSELLGLLINLPSGQAAGAMRTKGGNRHFQTHTQIFEVTSCLDNQLLFSLSSRSRQECGPCTWVGPLWYPHKPSRARGQGTSAVPRVENLGNLPLHQTHPTNSSRPRSLFLL